MVKKRIGWKSAAARRLINMAGNPASVEEAVTILAHHYLEGVCCPPTDLSAVAQRLNVVRICDEDLAGSGELRREKSGYVVVRGRALSAARKRFTTAHELGHALFEMSGPYCPRSGTELEKLCNKFATAILMPKRTFLEVMGPQLSISRIFELAKVFETSLSATTIRCCELTKAAAFEVHDGDIRSLGGPVRTIDSILRAAVDETLLGKTVNTIVYLNTSAWSGYWKLEGVTIGKEKRALFLLQPSNGGNENA